MPSPNASMGRAGKPFVTGHGLAKPSADALAGNVMAFGRLLRRCGLPVGPAESIAAAEALNLTGPDDRETVRAALSATLLRGRDGAVVFEQAFELFWRDPDALHRPAAPGEADAADLSPAARRVSEALNTAHFPPAREPPPGDAPPEVAVSVSARERLAAIDFESMSAGQVAEAALAMRQLTLHAALRPTRRFRPDPAGPRTDLRATVRHAGRHGGEILGVRRARRRAVPPPLVALCDISGSMSRYARVLLHFLHALTQRRSAEGGVMHSFLFGTRLTNVSRSLRVRDPEAALAAVGRAVPDWSGGTRIGDSLALFNRLWGRRVLGAGAVVLLITDGLDRQGAAGLSEAAERLARSARRLIWLNPLLRFRGFQPRSQGARALLPHVHEHRPVHDLDSLGALVAALSSGAALRPVRRSSP